MMWVWSWQQVCMHDFIKYFSFGSRLSSSPIVVNLFGHLIVFSFLNLHSLVVSAHCRSQSPCGFSACDKWDIRGLWTVSTEGNAVPKFTRTNWLLWTSQLPAFTPATSSTCNSTLKGTHYLERHELFLGRKVKC